MVFFSFVVLFIIFENKDMSHNLSMLASNLARFPQSVANSTYRAQFYGKAPFWLQQ